MGASDVYLGGKCLAIRAPAGRIRRDLARYGSRGAICKSRRRRGSFSTGVNDLRYPGRARSCRSRQRRHRVIHRARYRYNALISKTADNAEYRGKEK